MISFLDGLTHDEQQMVRTMYRELLILVVFSLLFIFEVNRLKGELSATRGKLAISMEREAVAVDKAAELKENLRITKLTLRKVVNGEEGPAVCSSWWPWYTTDA